MKKKQKPKRLNVEDDQIEINSDSRDLTSAIQHSAEAFNALIKYIDKGEPIPSSLRDAAETGATNFLKIVRNMRAPKGRIPYKAEPEIVSQQEEAIDHVLGNFQAALREANAVRALQKNSDLIPIKALEILSDSLALGLFPRWEVLEIIGRAWQRYGNAAGNLSLGDAFYGEDALEPTKRARKKAVRDASNDDLFHLIENFRLLDRLSLEEAIKRTLLTRRLVLVKLVMSDRKHSEWIAEDEKKLENKISSILRAHRRRGAGSKIRKRESDSLSGSVSLEQDHFRRLVGLPIRPVRKDN